MRLFSRYTGGVCVATTAVLLAAMPRIARSTQPGPCPAPRAGVPRWNEAGPVNGNRNLRLSIEAGGVPLVYDSERVATATPYGGPGWSLGVGRSETTGTTVVIDDAGMRSTFTETSGGFQGEPFDHRTLAPDPMPTSCAATAAWSACSTAAARWRCAIAMASYAAGATTTRAG